MEGQVLAATHEVTNQAPPLCNYNAFETEIGRAHV